MMNDAIAVESFIDFCDDMMITPTPANEATFNFLPKFKKEPVLAKYENDAKQAEALLALNGIDSKTTALKFVKLILRFLDIYTNAVDTAIGLPICIFIVTIPIYLLDRLLSYGLNVLQEYLSAEEAKKILVGLNKARAKARDPKERKKLDKSIAKISAAIKKLS